MHKTDVTRERVGSSVSSGVRGGGEGESNTTKDV